MPEQRTDDTSARRGGPHIRHVRFDDDQVRLLPDLDARYVNWPVVYTLNDRREVYVGESLNVAARFKQHRENDEKQRLTDARVIVDDTFNKSACLDLESYLIRLLDGDGKFRVLNRNEGVTDADYYERDRYRSAFAGIVDALRAAGVFEHSVAEIENSDLFKLSPFKALNPDQTISVESIVDALVDDLRAGTESTSVVQGEPGTGKTIVAIYLIKLLRDIALTDPAEVVTDSLFAELFTPENHELLREARIGLVVPQQSLRSSIRRVFRKTPGLSAEMVLTPFQVGEAEQRYDLLVVDEAHRLNQRANQSTGVLNAKFAAINARLFGADDPRWTQLDWITERSAHRLLLVDTAQRVRPADLPSATLRELGARARQDGRHFHLQSQMRVAAGSDYVQHVRRILSPGPGVAPRPRAFPGYELEMFDDLGRMRDRLAAAEAEHGLARLVAGFAWPWRSKNDPAAVDISLDGQDLQWNRTATDWISSPGAVREVGSIHTVQGYDLNYAGVIIGPDLRYDPVRDRLVFDRAHYFDAKGKENNPQLRLTYSDDDLLEFVCNIYAVLMTRGMRGTFVYACDSHLRRYLRGVLRPATSERHASDEAR
jgi:DUF2075 family protein